MFYLQVSLYYFTNSWLIKIELLKAHMNNLSILLEKYWNVKKLNFSIF